MLYPHNHRRRICTERQFQRGLCNITSHHPNQLNPFLNSNSSTRQSQVLYPRQASDAILYASLVALFYAAIILIVVGSNCHRFRKQHSSSERGARRTAKHLLTMTDTKLNIFHIVLKRHRSPTSSDPQIAIV
ncbi:uncharacterized protein LOC129963829 isoform X2 [Argiope bruennichi]|uniref:Uncharacterized protein n=1 Tax=Argiope bruennichi TaxID=94029 RepID=A0A8T0F1F1_ARGBR|nr:uncharacterized protein LOC129963829 isoform X2 [Argiope bruennichi]KAF8782352.1 hypothetical protein HNY73_012648 [Argiope bruennichi]